MGVTVCNVELHHIENGEQIKIRINTDMPVQVDGEPWIQTPGDVVILKSALKATMLRKTKMKRRNTEPALAASAESRMERITMAPEHSISERPDE